VVFLYVRPDVERDELLLERKVDPEDERELDGGADLRELDPELRLLPELRLPPELLDDEGGDFLRLCLATDAEAIIITTENAVNSVKVLFSLVSCIIVSSA